MQLQEKNYGQNIANPAMEAKVWAMDRKTNPGDFSSAAFQASTDGELFYRTDKGRDEMPAYEKKIPEANDRWALVAFMRTLKK